MSSLNASKNSLALETSPYLLQHKSNPVHWMPWGEKAFEKAKQEDKPIFLSIGYSTCHWCHVMERDSFTNQKIAYLLNSYFISIKVDREELPQVDVHYQEIYKKSKGRVGGWPLSVFMSPTKDVFFIASYLPASREAYSEGLDTLLPRLAQEYKNGFHKLQLQQKEKKNTNTILSLQSLKNSLLGEYDDIYGGFGTGKKFPEVQKILLMMDLAKLLKDKELAKNAYDTLDAMAMHGLYDHVGGGFFRYSVDASWETPHFEKMLYTQAELIGIYVRAYLQSGKFFYKEILQESISMVNRRFAVENLFYSASDADAEEQEGYFYTYSAEEMQIVFKKIDKNAEIQKALDFYVTDNVSSDLQERVHLSFETDKRVKNFQLLKKELLKIRAKKIPPFVDTKINTAWNAMMIEALYKASVLDKKYKKMADKHLKSLTNIMFDRGELYHQTILGVKAKQLGLLEDYSFFIAALISGYESDYDTKKLDFAEYLLLQAKRHFYRDGVWYLSDDGLNVKADSSDKYYTSPRAKMLQNIINLANLKENFSYEKLAKESLKTVFEALTRTQSNMPATARAYLMLERGVYLVKANKKNLLYNKLKIKKMHYPYLLSKSIPMNDYLFCSIRQCMLKEKDLKKLSDFMDNNLLSEENSF